MIADKESENLTDVQFCVVAFIDLLGFAQHLEVGAYDIRTTIGSEAVVRLETLNEAESLIAEESKIHKDYYPSKLRVVRINDSLILGIDLPKLLMPSIGKQRWEGFSANDLDKYFTEEELDTEESYFRAYDEKAITATADVVKFLGLVARTHVFITQKEDAGFHPGPKTVVSTGFRRPFLDRTQLDFLSANFAFSNAFLAEQSLKGSALFLDEIAVELACKNQYARNILRIASHHRRSSLFQYLNCEKESSMEKAQFHQLEPIDIKLFRKNYKYLKLRADAMEYMQILEQIAEILEGTKKIHKNAGRFNRQQVDRIRDSNLPITTFGNWMRVAVLALMLPSSQKSC